MGKVLRLGGFRRLAIAYGLNELAVQVAAVVLATYVYRRTGSAAGAASFFLCTQFLPSFASPALVARLDRAQLGTVLPALYAVEALLFTGLAAGVAAGLPIVLLLALTLLDGIVALTARSLARVAAVAVTARRGLLREGNALNNAVFSVCYLLGPAFGGLLLLIGDTTSALMVDAAAFALIAIVLARAHEIPSTSEARLRRPRMREALSYAAHDQVVRRLLALRAIALVALTISVPVELILAEHTLHSGATGYALLLTAWGAGTVLGSIVYAVARTTPARTMLAIGAGLLAAGFLIMALAPTLAVAIPGAVLAGSGNGIDAVCSRTILQESVQDRWQALVTALHEAMWQALPGAGILIGAGLAGLAGARGAMAVAAGGAAVLVLLTWRVLHARARSADEDVQARPEAAISTR